VITLRPVADVKGKVKEHFPKELWDVIDPTGTSDNPPVRKKMKLKLSTKSNRDKLAEFDEQEETEIEEAVEDDDFDEDENEDLGNDDYNAERYFEGGEDDYEEFGGGGDDGGGDEW
jgi:DNA-directed RNA polymerase III subunit RPC7